MTEAEKTGVDNPYRYSTKEWDEKSGLYYFGARYYSPEIGRWMQRDPAGTVDGLNLYLYVRNAPVGLLDAMGYQTQSAREQCCKIAVTACVGWAVYAGARIIVMQYEYLRPVEERRKEIRALVASTAAICGAAYLLCLPYPGEQAKIEETMKNLRADAEKAIASLRRAPRLPPPQELDIPKGPYIPWPLPNPFKPFEPIL